MTSTQFSVVLPTYNRAGLIARTIQSVLDQTWESWELIIIDDGSTDETAQVVSPFLKDARIRYLRQTNSGQAVARNRGISTATGDYIAFLDSDDLWLPMKLELQAEALMRDPSIDVVYGQVEYIGLDDRKLDLPTRRGQSGIIWRRLLYDNCISFVTATVKRNRLLEHGGMDEAVRRGDDYDLWLRLAPSCRFHFQDKVVAQIRVEGDRITNDVDGRLDSNRQMLENFFHDNPELLTARERRSVEAMFLGRFARAYFAYGRRRTALALAMKGILKDPTHWQAWRTLGAVALKSA